MYNAEILRDSVNPEGDRLTTMRVTMPRFILAEFNTHRRFSRNAASSRAIPVARRIQQVKDHGFIPEIFGKEQRGMQATSALDESNAHIAYSTWRRAMNDAVENAQILADLGVHKQLANRLLEPFVWVTVIVSSTEWDNFFTQRISPLAQPEMRRTAALMKAALDASTPTQLQWYDWHVPMAESKEVAVGRIARVSYETDPKTDEEEIALGKRLRNDRHWSPFEHIAMAQSGYHINARNYQKGWTQWRAFFD